MRMLAAELLKLRRRWATYIVLVLLIVLMGLIFFLVGLGGRTSGASQVIRFPQAFGLINQFVFGLGSLLAVAYAAAIGGADWNWGVFRVVVARGESRGRYILVKYIGLALVILIGCVIAFAAGIVLTFFAGTLAGVSVGNPFEGSGPRDIATSLALGFPVIAERAAIGFAVAVLLRSQLAGVVVGIILYIGESILAAVLIATNLAGAFSGSGGFPRLGQQWYQFLPFSIGDSVLSHGPSVTGQDLEGLILTPVPLDAALAATLIYLAAALALVVVSVERSEISA